MTFPFSHRLGQVARLSVLSAAVLLAACGGSDDNDPVTPPAPPPAPVEPTPSTVKLDWLGSYATGRFAESAAEIPAYDPVTRRVFVVNAAQGALDVLDLVDPANPRHIGQITTHHLRDGAEANSVAVHEGVVAVAVQAARKTDPGFVAFFRAADLSLLGQVDVGALPDMLTFTPDGKTVLVANEGEPSDDYQIDPEGSISVIDVSDWNQLRVRTADFHQFNDQADALRARGVRIFGPGASVAQDLEPEYIAVSADGRTAWAALQENNAFARLDIASATITDIVPLGFKDHGVEGQGMDVSDADGEIAIKPWPGVRGMYQPDAIAAFEAGGRTYLISANEGDARAWGEDNDAYWAGDASQGFVEEFRVKHLVHKGGFDRRAGDDLPPQLRALAEGAILNPEVFGYCGAVADFASGTADPGDCREDELLGRLNVTWTMGYQTHADGTPRLQQVNGKSVLVYDTLYSYGGRSIAIWDDQGKRVWDSGDQFERIIAERLPREAFNANHEESGFDNRSDNKGPEPEGVTVGRLGDKTYAFVGLERVGGVMVYDVTNPQAPVFVDYLNRRDFSISYDPEAIEADPALLARIGDLGPEGLAFVPGAVSPTGEPLVIVGNEVSGTTSVFQVKATY